MPDGGKAIEPWVWFFGGAIGSLAGLTNVSSGVWLLFVSEEPLWIFPVVGAIAALALVVRWAGPLAARIWAALTWMVTAGLLLLGAIELIANAGPVAVLLSPRTVTFAVIWAAACGLLAVALYQAGQRLLRTPR